MGCGTSKKSRTSVSENGKRETRQKPIEESKSLPERILEEVDPNELEDPPPAEGVNNSLRIEASSEVNHVHWPDDQIPITLPQSSSEAPRSVPRDRLTVQRQARSHESARIVSTTSSSDEASFSPMKSRIEPLKPRHDKSFDLKSSSNESSSMKTAPYEWILSDDNLIRHQKVPDRGSLTQKRDTESIAKIKPKAKTPSSKVDQPVSVTTSVVDNNLQTDDTAAPTNSLPVTKSDPNYNELVFRFTADLADNFSQTDDASEDGSIKSDDYKSLDSNAQQKNGDKNTQTSSAASKVVVAAAAEREHKNTQTNLASTTVVQPPVVVADLQDTGEVEMDAATQTSSQSSLLTLSQQDDDERSLPCSTCDGDYEPYVTELCTCPVHQYISQESVESRDASTQVECSKRSTCTSPWVRNTDSRTNSRIFATQSEKDKSFRHAVEESRKKTQSLPFAQVKKEKEGPTVQIFINPKEGRRSYRDVLPEPEEKEEVPIEPIKAKTEKKYRKSHREILPAPVENEELPMETFKTKKEKCVVNKRDLLKPLNVSTQKSYTYASDFSDTIIDYPQSDTTAVHTRKADTKPIPERKLQDLETVNNAGNNAGGVEESPIQITSETSLSQPASDRSGNEIKIVHSEDPNEEIVLRIRLERKSKQSEDGDNGSIS